jgi:hypothetical protein
VLGCAIDRDSNFVGYITRRFFRIVPPFVFSVLFAFACVTLVRIDPMPFGLTDFFQRPFWPQPTLDQLSDNLILRSSWINGPTWSIWPELVGSLKIGDLLTGRDFLAWPVFIVGFVVLRAVRGARRLLQDSDCFSMGHRSRFDGWIGDIFTVFHAMDGAATRSIFGACLFQLLPAPLAYLLHLRDARSSQPPCHRSWQRRRFASDDRDHADSCGHLVPIRGNPGDKIREIFVWPA